MSTAIQEAPAAKRSVREMREVTNSELASFKDCPRKREFRYEVGWVPRIVGASTLVGSAIHRGKEMLYQGFTWDAIIEAVREIFNSYLDRHEEHLFDPQKYRDARDLSIEIMGNYLTHWWGQDNQTARHPVTGELLVEPEFKIPVYSEKGNPSSLYIFRGKVDRIITLDDEYWVEETKTRDQISDDTFESLVIDQQSRGYCWAVQVYLGIPIAGVCYDVVRRKSPGTPKVNKDGTVSSQKCDTHLSVLMDLLQKQDKYLKSLSEEERKAGKLAKCIDWAKYEAEIERLKGVRFFERRYQRYTGQDLMRIQREIHQVTLNMHNTTYAYMNDSACGHWGGCRYRPVCKGEDPGAIFTVARQKHSELGEDTEFHAPLGKAYSLKDDLLDETLGMDGLIDSVSNF